MASDVEIAAVERHRDGDPSQPDARRPGDGHDEGSQTQDVQGSAQAAPVPQSTIQENGGAHNPAHGSYDYSKLDRDVAARARASAERIKQWHRDAILSTGNELRERRDDLGHGEFMKWCAQEVRFSDASVRNYMAAAREFSGVPLIVSVLPRTIVYRFAGASEDVRCGVVARVEAGEAVDPDEVVDLIKKGRAEAERLKSPEKAAKKEEAAKRRLQREAREKRKYDQMQEELDRKEATEIDGAIAIVRRWDVSKDELFQVLRILGRLNPERVRKHLEGAAPDATGSRCG